MEYIDDLSFSGLVDLIQGDEIKGANVLNTIAKEMEENKKLIKELEKDLELAKNRESSLITGTQRVIQHLKKEYPLAVVRKDYIIVITENNITIEKNIIKN